MSDLGELPSERAGTAAPEGLLQRRAMIAQAASGPAPWRDAVKWREDRLGGVRVLRFSPEGERKGTVVHFHGGGFRMGAPEMTGTYAAALVKDLEVEVVVPAYRLAPENPFPAGLNDAKAVLLALKAEGAPKIILSGDSAGGGVAASLAAWAPSLGAPVAGLVGHSPWLDATVTAASYDSKLDTDKLFSKASASEAAEQYLQGASPKHPLASPLFAPAKSFPPTLLTVGDIEVLLDDSVSFEKALSAAGVPVTLHREPDMEHTAVTRDRSLPGAEATYAATVVFIRRILAS
jgi:acetyl esterase/lipase